MLTVYNDSWKIIGNRWKQKFRYLGLILNAAILGVIQTYLVAFLGVYFDLDPVYFLLQIGNISSPSSSVTLGLRQIALFFYIQTICRLMCSLFLYCVITFQAYFCSIKLLSECREENHARLGMEYRKLFLCHLRLLPFANRVNSMLLFLGHTSCLTMFWLSIRGWEFVPPLLNSFFPFTGMVVFVWIILILTTLSGIQEASRGFVWKRFKDVQMLEKWNHRKKMLLTRQGASLVPISFKCGSAFSITRDSSGNYVNTVLDNLTTAVFTF